MTFSVMALSIKRLFINDNHHTWHGKTGTQHAAVMVNGNIQYNNAQNYTKKVSKSMQ